MTNILTGHLAVHSYREYVLGSLSSLAVYKEPGNYENG